MQKHSGDWDGDDLVHRPDIERVRGDLEAHSAACYGDDAAHASINGEGALQLRDFGAHYKAALLEHGAHPGTDRILVGEVGIDPIAWTV